MLYYSQEYLPVSVSSFNIGNIHILVKSNDNFIHTLNRYIIQVFVKMNGVDTGTQSTTILDCLNQETTDILRFGRNLQVH